MKDVKDIPCSHCRPLLPSPVRFIPSGRTSGCVFAQVLRIREKLRTRKKLEKRERDFLRQNPDLVQPPVRLSAAEKALLKEWT